MLNYVRFKSKVSSWPWAAFLKELSSPPSGANHFLLRLAYLTLHRPCNSQHTILTRIFGYISTLEEKSQLMLMIYKILPIITFFRPRNTCNAKKVRRADLKCFKHICWRISINNGNFGDCMSRCTDPNM